MPKVLCPACRQPISYEVAQSGEVVRCGNCQQGFRLPTSEGVPAPATPVRRRASGENSLITYASLAASLVAVIVSSLTLMVLRQSNSGLSNYRMDTPENAVRSIAKIHSTSDTHALMELRAMDSSASSADMASTLDVSKVASFGDKQCVFISYMSAGRRKNEVIWLEKHLTRKIWILSDVNNENVKATNEQLYKDILSWLASGDPGTSRFIPAGMATPTLTNP